MADTIGKLFDEGHTRWHSKGSERSRATTCLAFRAPSRTRKESVAGPARRNSEEDFDEAEIIGAVISMYPRPSPAKS